MTDNIQIQGILQSAHKYRLKPFEPVITEILKHFHSIDKLKELDCLELGPANLTDMMRFLKDQAQVKSISAAGRGIIWPWTRHKNFIRENIQNTNFLEFFKNNKSRKFDLIYSRHVMEQHSINPWILLASREYWAQFKKSSFNNFDEHYPASPANIQSVFKRAWKSLRPGGIIISQIAKHKYSCLDDEFLKKLKPAHIEKRLLGSLSCIISVTK